MSPATGGGDSTTVDVDPLPAWSRFSGPRLAIFGAEDERDDVPVSASVERLKRIFRQGESSPDAVRVFENRGHTLVDPDRGWIDPDVLKTLTGWILAAARR